MTLTRRDFARATITGSVLASLAGAEEPAFPGLTVRAYQPRNLEFPLSALKDAIVPDEQFFVRSHFAVPEINVKTWKLKVEGAVDKPFELSMDDVVKLPANKLTATLECAGNGRVYIVPAVGGVQWGQGREQRRVGRRFALGNSGTSRCQRSQLLK